MNASRTARIVLAPALVLALFIAGCEKSLSGVYQLDGPIPLSVEFKSGKAVFTMGGPGGITHDSTYTVEGDTVKIAKDPEGKAMNLTINSDGTLTGPAGLKFTKKS